MAVPPGVSPADFAAALAEFGRIVGKEWLFTSDEDLDLYRDSYSPLAGEPDERVASAAVAPKSTEEVQAIVRVANRYRVPIYPISTGKNLGYGGSAPVYSGSVIVDLKRMNRILEINEANAYVLVEPGVSYFDLYEHIRAKGLKLWIDCPDPGWGSVLGNAIDRGGGYTMANYRNHFDSHSGMEVVLPSGEVMRTGMGAIPNATTWQQYKSGAGPLVDGIFSQANYGIVTKMGFWLMPEPEAFLRGVVRFPRYADIHTMVETLNYLENARITTGFPDLDSPLLGSPAVGAVQLYNEGLRSFPMTDAHKALLAKADNGYSPELEAYGIAGKIPYWQLYLSYYGPPEVIAAQWAATQRRFGHVQGVTFDILEQVTLPITTEQAMQYHEPEFGVPSLRAFSIGARTAYNPEPSHGHMWFSPIIPRTGAAILEANRVFGAAAREIGMPLFQSFALPACFWERSFIFILATPVTEDPATNRKYVEGFRKLIEIGGKHGWGEYRTAPVFQEAVMDVYSFNDHALKRFHETLKDAIDPNGIIAAGRYAIWPKHLRGKPR
ncbi:MAG: pchF 3 [Sphingomonas bacterium]|nr:pchF 3 [Sphingomonas bacterium]